VYPASPAYCSGTRAARCTRTLASKSHFPLQDWLVVTGGFATADVSSYIPTTCPMVTTWELTGF